MDTDRTAYKISARNPGSDVAAETAAAMAAAAIVFRKVDRIYSDKLLAHAQQVSHLVDQLLTIRTSLEGHVFEQDS